MTPLVDSHVHLDDTRFDMDRSRVMERARDAGVGAMIVPAVAALDWPALADLATRHGDVFPAYGMHPMFLPRHRLTDCDLLDQWLDTHRAVAVGEIGLDYFVEGLDRDRQQVLFGRQLSVAANHRLPVIVHARRAVDAVIAAIRRHPGTRGVVHSFSGSVEQAGQLFKLGFLVGIGGPVTYPRAQRLRRVVAELPVEQLLLESDAPDQPGIVHRGQRNEPSSITETLAELASLRGEHVEQLAAATTENARRLFDLDIPAR